MNVAELLKRGAGDDETVVASGEYVLRIESVNVVKSGTALRLMCRVVGGDEDGMLVAPGLYDFGPGMSPSGFTKSSLAIRNLLAWV